MNEIVILNGTVIDGSGGEPYAADIRVRGEEIAEIKRDGPLNAGPRAQIMDAAGKVVTPGFVDIHRHCDYAVFREDFGAAERAQGITSIVSGNCGLTPYPSAPENIQLLDALLAPVAGTRGGQGAFADYPGYAARCRRHLSAQRTTPHVDQLIGSCAVRMAVKGMAKTPFTSREMDRAAGYVREAMDAGARGLSFGLMYYPEYYSAPEELMALARAAARHGGVLTCHMRGEGDSLAESVREIIHIARQADAPLQISHFKSCGARNWGVKIYEAIEIIEAGRRQGAEIHVDVYPYTGGATTLQSLLPPGYMKENMDEARSFMAGAVGAARLEEMLARPIPGWDNYIEALGFGRIIISLVKNRRNQVYVGKSLQDIMDEQPGTNPYAFIAQLLADEACETGVTVMSMAQADVDTVAGLPYAMFVSDALYPETGLPHPRAYGAFPRVLRDMVRERKILTLPEAIRKMTALPAEKLRLEKRGRIRAGYTADLCVFDPEKIRDNADWPSPRRLAAGMDAVLVRGRRWETPGAE